MSFWHKNFGLIRTDQQREGPKNSTTTAHITNARRGVIMKL